MATKRRDVLAYRELTPQEIYAVRATWAGEANSEQQRVALNVVMTVFSAMKMTPFQAGDPTDSAFLTGRFFVGQCLAEIIEKPMDQLVEVEPSEHEEQRD